MKFIKKIYIYLFVGFLCCSSVVLSYEKANNCKAAEIVLGGAIVISLGALLYGAYYVSQPENQEEIKESLSNYKDMTVEGARATYEINKKLFNDFCEYATSKAGGNAAVHGADGSTHTIKQMQQTGFPDFDEWDEYMKKQGAPSSGGFGSIWDKLSFGLGLLDLIRGFFDDDNNSYSGTGGTGLPQLYYTGDEGYKDFENKSVDISMFGLMPGASRVSYSPLENDYWTNSYTRKFSHTYNIADEGFKSIRFFAVLVDLPTSKNLMYYEEGKNAYCIHSYWVQARLYCCNGGSSVSPISYCSYYSDTTWSVTERAYLTYEGDTNQDMIVYSSYYPDTTYLDFYFFSTNVPLFATLDEGKNYALTGDASTALNLPPTVSPAPEPSVEPSRPVTPVSIYCNSFNGRNVAPSDVVNVNYYIANNWDNATENLTTVINNYYNSDDTGEPENEVMPTDTPIPPLPDDDGSNTTYNFLINITNILNPIKVTVENIYNFFQIDTEQISNAWNFDYVPAADFEPLVSAFDKLSNAFGEDAYQVEVTETPLDSSGTGGGSSLDSSGTGGSSSWNATSQQGLLLTDYPVISFKCPKILQPYIDTVDVDGSKVIILCDFEDYAIYFVRFRAFINAVLWIGMLFYLTRELRCNFVIR